MAEGKSSGLKASSVSAPALLSQLPRALGGRKEEREEYTIAESVGNRYGTGRRSYGPGETIQFPRVLQDQGSISYADNNSSTSPLSPRGLSCGSCNPYRAAA
ncbi:MAG: hypothetical protein ABH864_02830 [archaeon]